MLNNRFLTTLRCFRFNLLTQQNEKNVWFFLILVIRKMFFDKFQHVWVRWVRDKGINKIKKTLKNLMTQQILEETP